LAFGLDIKCEVFLIGKMETLIVSDESQSKRNPIENPADLLTHPSEKREIFFQKVSEEIVRALRGNFNQREFSKMLGFSFNQVGKWENGSTRIKWSDFLHVANVLKLPLEKKFRYFLWNFQGPFDGMSTMMVLLSHRQHLQLPWPSIKIRRWKKGESSPDFSDILHLLALSPAEFFSFFADFVDFSKIESLKADYEKYQIRLSIVAADPLCVYVNAALQLNQYKESPRHDENLLMEHSTCDLQQLRNALELMSKAGIVTFDGNKYYPCGFDFRMGSLRADEMRYLIKHATDLVAQRFPLVPLAKSKPRPKNSCRSSVRVVAMSEATSKKLDEMIVKFHADVGALVTEDCDPKENVQVIVLQSVTSNFGV